MMLIIEGLLESFISMQFTYSLVWINYPTLPLSLSVTALAPIISIMIFDTLNKGSRWRVSNYAPNSYIVIHIRNKQAVTFQLSHFFYKWAYELQQVTWLFVSVI